MFGPRINFRMGRVVPYAQFLFGAVHEWGLTSLVSPTTPFRVSLLPVVNSSPNGFASAAGVGVDINITRHIAVKPFQVEYFMTQLPNFVDSPSIVQNSLRYSGGIVFNFGAK
jgi:hypothetical protein